MLEKETELENGRIMIYGCSECLDIGCGAMTVKVERLDDSIVWKDFAYENGYEETDFEEYKKIGSFVFDQKAYQDLFTEIRYCNTNV